MLSAWHFAVYWAYHLHHFWTLDHISSATPRGWCPLFSSTLTLVAITLLAGATAAHPCVAHVLLSSPSVLSFTMAIVTLGPSQGRALCPAPGVCRGQFCPCRLCNLSPCPVWCNNSCPVWCNNSQLLHWPLVAFQLWYGWHSSGRQPPTLLAAHSAPCCLHSSFTVAVLGARRRHNSVTGLCCLCWPPLFPPFSFPGRSDSQLAGCTGSYQLSTIREPSV